VVDEIRIPFDGNTKCQCGADFSKYGARCTCPRPKDDEIKPKYVDGDDVPENDWEAVKKSFRENKAACVFGGNAGKNKSDDR
jgi:hypothetical protein